jgi:hypothetical protein
MGKFFSKPELEEAHRLITLFNEILGTDEVKRRKWQILVEHLRNIIENPVALNIKCESDWYFKDSYHRHFKLKENTFRKFDCPYDSMAADIVRQKYC